MSNYKNLLIGEPPLQVLPTLAKSIGLNEAIVLQQLHYWLENPKAAGYVDETGTKWIFNSYGEWVENFPFWSEHTIQRIFLSLEKQGIIISEQLAKDKYDRRKYYRIDYEWLEQSTRPTCNTQESQNGALDDAKLACSLNESETTAKTTTETIAKTSKKSVSLKDLPLDWQIACSDSPVQAGHSAEIDRIRQTWENVVKYARFDAQGWQGFDEWLLKYESTMPIDTVCRKLVEDDFRAKQIRSGMYSIEGDKQGKYSLKAVIKGLDALETPKYPNQGSRAEFLKQLAEA